MRTLRLLCGLLSCLSACTSLVVEPLALAIDSAGTPDAPDAASTGTNDAPGTTDTGAVPDAAASADLANQDANAADSAADAAAGDAIADTATPAACPADQVCVTNFPFGHDADTASAKGSQFDSYSCKPLANESGPEWVYRVTVPAQGFLSAAVHDGAGVDVDVHILGALDPAKCLDRGDSHARADVQAGTYYVVVDTFVSQGKAQAGRYHVDIGWLAPTTGACALQFGGMARVNDGGKTLPMPATGPVVMEAHLVTQAEPPPYPHAYTEKLAAHYTLSQAKTGLVMFRQQGWAPKEGGTFFGAGIASPTKFPVVDEGWYANMYWTPKSRPPPGTRMILRKSGTDRAVVVSAGYETGPGNLAHIAGTPEEPHFYLGTGHLSVLQVGIVVDQTPALGPRRCSWVTKRTDANSRLRP